MVQTGAGRSSNLNRIAVTHDRWQVGHRAELEDFRGVTQNSRSQLSNIGEWSSNLRRIAARQVRYKWHIASS